jgi:hypothetical protein
MEDDYMFIRVTTSPDKKHKKVYLVEGYRDHNKKVKQRIIKSFGDLNDLERDNPNAL